MLGVKEQRVLEREYRTLDMADVRVGLGVEFFAPKSLFMMAVALGVDY